MFDCRLRGGTKINPFLGTLREEADLTPEEMEQKITLHLKEYDSHEGRLGRLQRSLVHLSVIAEVIKELYLDLHI